MVRGISTSVEGSMSWRHTTSDCTTHHGSLHRSHRGLSENLGSTMIGKETSWSWSSMLCIRCDVNNVGRVAGRVHIDVRWS